MSGRVVQHAGKVLITDHTWPDVDLERGILEQAGLQVTAAPRSDEATLRSLAADSIAGDALARLATSRT